MWICKDLSRQTLTILEHKYPFPNSHLTSRALALSVFVKRERGGGQRITGLSPPGLPDWPHNFVQLPVKWAEVAWSTLMDGALLCLAACSEVEPIPHGKSKLWLTISWWNIWAIIHLLSLACQQFFAPSSWQMMFPIPRYVVVDEFNQRAIYTRWCRMMNSGGQRCTQLQGLWPLTVIKVIRRWLDPPLIYDCWIHLPVYSWN